MCIKTLLPAKFNLENFIAALEKKLNDIDMNFHAIKNNDSLVRYLRELLNEKDTGWIN